MLAAPRTPEPLNALKAVVVLTVPAASMRPMTRLVAAAAEVGARCTYIPASFPGAIVRRHNEQVERICQEMVDRTPKPAGVRDWIDCLVRPLAEHLTQLGSPSTYARFSAQLMPDPGHRDLVSEESLGSSAVLQIMAGLKRALPDMPEQVRVDRNAMARQLIVHMFAERERALADGAPTPHPTWDAMATSLVDAITGLMLAPVTEES